MFVVTLVFRLSFSTTKSVDVCYLQFREHRCGINIEHMMLNVKQVKKKIFGAFYCKVRGLNGITVIQILNKTPSRDFIRLTIHLCNAVLGSFCSVNFPSCYRN